MKKKTFIVQLLDSKRPNKNSFTQVEDANFYSNDTEASLVFIPHEESFDFQTAKVVMYNRGDESLVERDAVVTTENGRKVASYELPDEIISHWGEWIAQPVFISSGDIYSGSIVSFSVIRYLMDNRPPTLRDIIKVDELYSQLVTIMDEISGKDVISAPEIILARGGENTLGERLDKEHNEVTAQLAQTTEGKHERSANAIQFGANPDNLNVDSTNAIENAISKVATYYKGSNAVGGRGYYTSNGKLKIPPGMYRITSTISLPVGIDIDMEGAIFVAYPSDKTLDCFDMTGSGFRNDIKGGTFVGFKSAITISTNNRNVSKLVFKGQSFHMCAVGIDTVSYSESRSTLLVIKEFISYETDLVIKTHCDMTHLDDGWISHSGYDGAAIYNQGFTKIENVVFVPRPPQDGARTRWIDNHSVDDGHETHGERGLKISHCRFGGEAGSMPIVYNYANADLDLVGFYNPTIISIDDSMLFSGGTLDESYIVLFSIPNRISLKNISGGLTSLNNGAVSCDSTFDSTLVENSKYITIEIDDTVKGANHFPIVAPDLHRFLRTPDNAHTMFRSTFLDGESIKRYFSIPTTTIGGSKVTIPIKTETRNSGAGQRNAGVAFLVSVSGVSGGSFIYKTQSLYYVSITGGAYNGAKRRINYSLLSSHGGGNGFTTEGLITSVHWGVDDTGSTDKEFSSTEENVTIVVDTGYNSSIVITPLHGVDNYS